MHYVKGRCMISFGFAITQIMSLQKTVRDHHASALPDASQIGSDWLKMWIDNVLGVPLFFFGVGCAHRVGGMLGSQ